MSKVFISIGTIQIYYYSIFILLGMLSALFILYINAKKENIDTDKLLDIVFYTVIFSLLGARLHYVLFNLDYYIKNPLEIIQTYKGGLAIHGGIIFGIITIYVLAKKKNIKFTKILDISAPALLLGQAIGRWGNFFNQEAYGNITSLKHLIDMHIPKFIRDNMYIDGLYREPMFLYESIGCFLGFIILSLLRRKKVLKENLSTAFYLVWYGILRFIIESRRSDSLMLGTLKVAQLISIIFILIGIIIFINNRKKAKHE